MVAFLLPPQSCYSSNKYQLIKPYGVLQAVRFGCPEIKSTVTGYSYGIFRLLAWSLWCNRLIKGATYG